MLEFGACPLCKLDISPERKKQHPIVCDHCGYTATNSEGAVQGELEKRSIAWMLVSSAFIIGTCVQVFTWDSAWLSVIPLSVKETIGMSTPADIEAKALICMELKKYDCVETQYAKAAQVDNGKWDRAGHFQMLRGKYNEAAQSYYKYFQAGGQNLEAQYNYAKALAELGQVDEATKYFDQVLAARPDTLQITVVQNYVKLLMNHQRYEQAKTLIEKIRKEAGPQANAFMEDEFNKISTASRD